MYKIVPIKALTDSYIWLIINRHGNCVIVDPGEAEQVMDYIKQEQLKPVAILITHHHYDHINGIAAINKEYKLPVFGGKNSTFGFVELYLRENDSIELSQFEAAFTAIETPGHTSDHISYHFEGSLFCGDTIFSAGCGRFPKEKAEQMLTSIEKIKQLPHETRIYCAHEYTLDNLEFAEHIEPDNGEISRYKTICMDNRKRGLPTLPSTLKQELQINPFLRCSQQAVIDSVSEKSGVAPANSADVLRELRKLKDNFKNNLCL